MFSLSVSISLLLPSVPPPLPAESGPASTEARLRALQRDMAARARRECDLEVERVRTVEVAAVRIEEQAQYQRMLQEVRCWFGCEWG